MTDDFTPPIKSRATDELLQIIGAPKKWNPKAVSLANNELVNRGVEQKKIETAKYLNKKKERIKKKEKSNESYNILDFIFNPFPTLIEILFSWELKKDGFYRKAKQQKYFRISLLMLIFLFFLFFLMTSE